MSYTDYDFPHTHFYDSDLRELLRFYKELQGIYNKLVADINALNDWKVEHEGEYEELLNRVKNIEGEINDFETEVEKKFAELETSIRKEQADFELEMRSDVERAINNINMLFNQLKNQLEIDINNMRIEIRNLIIYLNDQLASINKNVVEYIDDRLADFIAHLPDYEHLIVYNPVTGKQTTVQEAINDLYISFAVFGITAEQYDSLQLTATQFDSKQISAKEYDMLAYKILEYPDPNHYMLSPFTGRMVQNKIIIWQLAELHKFALTATQYDSLEIEAATYDNLDLTAYYYDWYGLNVGARGITSEEYDDIEIEAETYDNKLIGAYDYDNDARLILNAV